MYQTCNQMFRKIVVYLTRHRRWLGLGISYCSKVHQISLQPGLVPEIKTRGLWCFRTTTKGAV